MAERFYKLENGQLKKKNHKKRLGIGHRLFMECAAGADAMLACGLRGVDGVRGRGGVCVGGGINQDGAFNFI